MSESDLIREVERVTATRNAKLARWQKNLAQQNRAWLLCNSSSATQTHAPTQTNRGPNPDPNTNMHAHAATSTKTRNTHTHTNKLTCTITYIKRNEANLNRQTHCSCTSHSEIYTRPPAAHRSFLMNSLPSTPHVGRALRSRSISLQQLLPCKPRNRSHRLRPLPFVQP